MLIFREFGGNFIDNYLLLDFDMSNYKFFLRKYYVLLLKYLTKEREAAKKGKQHRVQRLTFKVLYLTIYQIISKRQNINQKFAGSIILGVQFDLFRKNCTGDKALNLTQNGEEHSRLIEPFIARHISISYRISPNKSYLRI